MKKIIIFGGYGFVGSNLYNELKKENRVLRYTSLQKLSKNKIKYNYLNFLKIIKKNKPDIIFFLSGTSNPNYSYNNHLYDLKKSNLILQSLLFVLKNLKFKGKMFFFSSIGVYGSSKIKKVSEKDKLNPESFYALSKVIAEEQCKFYQTNFKLNINILRVCSIFGPGLKRQIIYKIIKEIQSKKREIIFLGSKKDKREFLYVDDLIQIIKKLIISKINKQILNIGSNKQYLIYNIIKKIIHFSKSQKEIKFLNSINTPKLPILNNSQLYKLINIKKKYDLNYGLKKTYLYYK